MKKAMSLFLDGMILLGLGCLTLVLSPLLATLAAGNTLLHNRREARYKRNAGQA